MNTEKNSECTSSSLSSIVDEGFAVDNHLSPGNFQSRNKPEQLAWFRDAALGLFIHWSVDSQLGCVISHSLVGASDDYVERYFHDLPKTLNPKEWDFDHLAELAKCAGFQYAMLTTKHHNGFCLWDTKTTDFGIMNTPCRRDLVADYVAAFRRQGIRVGLYFSPEDFHFLYERGECITRSPLQPYSEEVYGAYRALLREQLVELLTNYGPIDALFFDGGDHETAVGNDGLTLQQYCLDLSWQLQPDVLITRGAIPTPEQQLPGIGQDIAWEACITLGTAWQYQPTNEEYKTGLHCIRLIAETRAKGGNLLLNIAPDANGALCREQENILREIALWGFINREAVYEVRPWIITNEENIWLLRHKDKNDLYAVLFDVADWDRGTRREFVIKSAKIASGSMVSVLGQSGEVTEYRPDLDTKVYWEQREDGLHIDAMNNQRVYCGTQWRNPLVLKITDVTAAFDPLQVHTAGEPKIAGNTVELSAEVVSMGSFAHAQLYFEYREYRGFAFSTYDGDWLSSDKIDVDSPGCCAILVSGMLSGTAYQYRAVLSTDKNVMTGEIKILEF